MTLQEARELRDEVRKAGFRATVPLGWSSRYFVRVTARILDGRLGAAELRFYSHSEWEAWQARIKNGK